MTVEETETICKSVGTTETSLVWATVSEKHWPPNFPFADLPSFKA